MKRSISNPAVLLILVCGLSVSGAAAWADGDDAELVHYAYSFEHRRASEALQVVLPLISNRGTIELQPGGNALVVRDSIEVVRRIRSQLQAFDSPLDPLRVRVQIVRAEPAAGTATEGASPDLPTGVLNRLRELLKYQSYSLLAGSEFEISEGTRAIHDVGDQYRVDFRLKQLLINERATLQGFELSRPGADGEFASLIQTDLVVELDQPMVLGLAPSEDSDTALMLVIDIGGPETATASVD